MPTPCPAPWPLITQVAAWAPGATPRLAPARTAPATNRVALRALAFLNMRLSPATNAASRSRASTAGVASLQPRLGTVSGKARTEVSDEHRDQGAGGRRRGRQAALHRRRVARRVGRL